MATTPEGKVKAKLRAALKAFEKSNDRPYGNLLPMWVYTPQAGPWGVSGTPDILVLIEGQLYGFECKATSKHKPTALQNRAMAAMVDAGAICYIVHDQTDIDAIIEKMRVKAMKDRGTPTGQ